MAEQVAPVLSDTATGAPGSTREAWVEEWSEDDIVLLHWRLLQEIRHLADPATPLEEKLDTLRWVFIAVALIGIAVAIHARVDDWKRGQR